jgi:uncharacterized protein (DUF2336 family)
MSLHALHIPELDELIMHGSPERQVKTLKRVTAFFLDGASRLDENHVQVFDLVFSRLIDHVASKPRTELSCRLAPLGNAPVEAVRRLAQDDSIAVAGPVLKQAERLSESDLIDIAENKSQAHLLAISARVRLDEPVTDVLLRRGDREVLRRLADNRGARLSDDGFCVLVERAKTDGLLAEKVVLRPDVPPRLFHDLLTATDAVQRRLTAGAAPARRSEIRHMEANVGHEEDPPDVRRDYSRAQRRVAALHQQGELDEALLVAFAKNGEYEQTIAALATLCAVPIQLTDRLMRASRTDPVLILCKSAGWAWPTVEIIIKARPGNARTSSQDLDTARAEFDLLSPATAQRVMRFWQVRSDHARQPRDDAAS